MSARDANARYRIFTRLTHIINDRPLDAPPLGGMGAHLSEYSLGAQNPHTRSLCLSPQVTGVGVGVVAVQSREY